MSGVLHLLLFVAATSVSMSTIAEKLTVIYDSGNTVSIAPYIKINGKTMTLPRKQMGLKKKTLDMYFPVTTPGMKPGKVDSRALSVPHFQTPLFIIGSDTLSSQWLITRVEELKALNAIGMLVEAKSIKELQEIRALAKGLRINAVSGQDIAEQLKLTHYPVLISKQGIEQ